MTTPHYRIYIDEVGTSDLKSSKDTNHRFLSLTGVIFNLDRIRTSIHSEIEALKLKYFDSHPDDPVILHRKEIINKKYPFQKLKNQALEEAFSAELLELFRNWDYIVISVLIDKYEHQQKYASWRYDPYHYCMEIILERYYRFLMDNSALGDVMVESRGGKEDMRLKRSYYRIYSEGTSYIESAELKKVLTSSQLKVKPKKLNVSGLQVADLLAFPARRYMLKYYNIKEDDRITFNEQIIEILKIKFYKHGNKTEGWGIKLLP